MFYYIPRSSLGSDLEEVRQRRIDELKNIGLYFDLHDASALVNQWLEHRLFNDNLEKLLMDMYQDEEDGTGNSVYKETSNYFKKKPKSSNPSSSSSSNDNGESGSSAGNQGMDNNTRTDNSSSETDAIGRSVIINADNATNDGAKITAPAAKLDTTLEENGNASSNDSSESKDNNSSRRNSGEISVVDTELWATMMSGWTLPDDKKDKIMTLLNKLVSEVRSETQGEILKLTNLLKIKINSESLAIKECATVKVERDTLKNQLEVRFSLQSQH